MDPITAFLVGWQLAGLIDKRWIHPVDPLSTVSALGEVETPRAEEGSPIPLFWGRVRVSGANVILADGYASRPIFASSSDFSEIGEDPQFIGFRYFIHLLFSLGMPGADSATLLKIWVGERLIWSGTRYAGDSHNTGTAAAAGNTINKPNLFGGLGGGGGVGGVMYFLPGTFEQVVPDNLRVVLTDIVGLDGDRLPAYRGQACVALSNTPFSPGWVLGENPTLDGYSFEVRAKTLLDDVDQPFPTLNSIGDGDANPACVLYDLLTNPWGRKGIDPALIDIASFTAAGETLQEEEHGISLWAAAKTTTRDLAKIVLTQISGVLYINAADGLWHLDLIRGGYDVETLPVFNRDNIIEVADYGKSTWSQAINEVKVKYTSRSRNYQDDEVPAADASLISRYGLNSHEVHYPGITTAKLAAQVAARDLRILSLPLASGRVIVNRDGFQMPPGGLFVLNMEGVEGWENHTPTVLRIFNVDEGKPGDERITLECAQDEFAFDYAITEPAEWETLPILDPTPIEERHITEAPRWLQLQKANLGALTDVDGQHLHHLAVPGDNDITYQARRRTASGTSFVTDSGIIGFPVRAVLAEEYDRENDPYDTTVGLLLDDLVGELGDGQTAVGAALGAGLLLLVGDDPALGEFVTWEEIADEGGGKRLSKIGRGALDTVPRTWPVGTRVYLIRTAEPGSGMGAIGSSAYPLTAELVVALTARAALGAATPTEEPYLDEVAVRLRTLLPYPPADLTVYASKTPAPIEEEGVDVTWKLRDRWSETITRGDAASETVEDDTTYTIIATKGDTETAIVTGLTVDSYDHLPLAAAGHGELAVSVRATRPDTVAGAPVTLTAWQDPSIDVTAYVWRNLLRNPRFAESPDFEHWTPVNDAIVDDDPAVALGGAGSYLAVTGIRPSGANQTVNVAGYFAARLRCLLDVYARNVAADADDTLTVTIEQLDGAGSTLVTTTYGPTAQSATLWSHLTLDVANCHADTVSLRVTIDCARVGGSNVNVAVTECILRLGQISNQLLANPDFSAGAFTSWTQVTGTWQALTATPYVGTYYARPNDGASAELAQTAAVPAGYEYGTAVCEFARMNDAASDTGFVVLEALDGGGTLIDSVSTADEAISPSNVWVRRRLALVLPTGTASVRVRACATRVSGTPLNSCFDDFDLRIHKHLDVRESNEYRFDQPTGQKLPRTPSEWLIAFPDVPYPNRGMWVGDSLQGALGTEPTMEDIDDAVATLTEAPFVGIYNEVTGSMVDQALEVIAAGGGFRTDGNTTFGNFRSSESFTVWIVFKSALEFTGAAGARGLVKRKGTTGWELRIADDGTPQALLFGAGATTAEALQPGDVSVDDRAIRYAALVYDATAQELRLVTDHGEDVASTVGLGEIRCNELVRFTVGEDFVGQIARVGVWSTAIATADLQSLWTHAGDPSGAGLDCNRDQPAATIVGLDTTLGQVVCRYAAEQVALGYDQELISDGGTGYGLAGTSDRTNRVPANASTDQDLVGSPVWDKGGGASVTFNAAAGPEGFRDAIQLVGSNAVGMRLDLGNIAVTAAANQRAVWFARADVDHTARARLINSSTAIKETHDFAVTTYWQRFTHLFTTWDDSTASCILQFFASDDTTSRTLYLAGPFYFGEAAQVPALIPAGGVALAQDAEISGATLPESFNTEGEVIVEGVATESDMNGTACLVHLDNGTDDHDRRDVGIDGTDAWMAHYDGAGTGVDSNAATGAVWSDRFVVRGRWCRAGLLDAASAFAGVVAGNDLGADADYGRATSWTATLVPLDRVHLGHADGADKFDGLIRVVVLNSRESRLPAAP